MINNYSNFVKYTGLGNTSKYSFPFKITNTNQIRILVFNTLTDELIVSQKADEGGFVASAMFNINKAGGEITLANDLALDRELIIKLSMNEGLQPYQYREQDDFRLRHFENGLDHVVMHIQRLYEKFTRVLGFDEKLSYHETFNPTLDTPVEIKPKSYMRTKADGTGVELREFYGDVVDVVREFIEEGGGGVPSGGLEHAVLEKKSDDDGDGDWTDPIAYDGISARFGSTQFTANGLKATLDAIIQITYTPPTISLSGSSNVIREKGASVSGITLTAALTKKSNPIEAVRFYRNPSTLLDTQTSGGGIPSGGNSTYAYATAFTDTVTFRAEVDDTLVSGNQTLGVTSTTTYTFVYPYYYGAGATGKTGAQIRSDLTNDIIVAQTNKLVSFSAVAGNRLYFAYPAAYSALTSILDVNSFETISDWTQNSVSIVGLDGSSQSYRVYTFNNLVGVSGTIQYTFKR